MEVDYLVVDKMINIKKLFDYNCMFSIGANLRCYLLKHG
jgi:hypothetical protein